MEKNVNAYHLGFRIDLRKVDELVKSTAVRKDATFRMYKIDNSFLYFKNFGGVVFINCESNFEEHILAELNATEKKSIELERYTIDIEASNEIHVDFTTIYLPELTDDYIQIICLNLAQSVALDHYQAMTDELLVGTSSLSSELELTGRIKPSRKKLAQFIGKTMNLKNRIAENLYIFETPALAWSEESLALLDEKLNTELDFKNRHISIQHNISIVKENLEFYIDMLQHKHSSLLEWIIIILILFEVVHIFV